MATAKKKEVPELDSDGIRIPTSTPPEPTVYNHGIVSASYAEPKLSFTDLAANLATAEAEAKTASADAGVARLKRSTVAVEAIKAAFAEKIAGEDIRKTLLDQGVLKGTVSKIVTIVNALNDGVLVTSDVKSLNGAYTTVIAHAAALRGASTATGGTIPTPTVVKGATTPEEAWALILDSIRAERDPDKQYKLGGEWITKATNEISDLLKNSEPEEE